MTGLTMMTHPELTRIKKEKSDRWFGYQDELKFHEDV
jgi:hypothetical protein